LYEPPLLDDASCSRSSRGEKLMFVVLLHCQFPVVPHRRPDAARDGHLRHFAGRNAPAVTPYRDDPIAKIGLERTPVALPRKARNASAEIDARSARNGQRLRAQCLTDNAAFTVRVG
jgi:hypothetical protein